MMNNNNKSNSYASPESSSSLSSPPTPSSPLPVSVGPGNKRYCFSSSPSPSPPFSPPLSTTFTSTSAENLPPHKNIIQHYNFYMATTDSNNKYNTPPLTAAAAALPSMTFSLDHHDSLSRTSSSCLQDLWNRIEWVVGRCCCCFGSWPPLFHNFQSNNLTIKQRLD